MSEDQSDFLKKRDDFTVEIRRAQREQMISKRRNMSSFNSIEESHEQEKSRANIIIDERYRQSIEQFINAEYDESVFDQLAACLNSNDVLMQHKGAIGIRKMLARNVDPPIKRFIDKGLTNRCLWLAKQKDYPQIKLETTWILTNVASGQSKFCERLVERGGIQLFLTLLQENQTGIVDQAIWGIGNLAADQIKFRDIILKKGGIQILTKIIENTTNKQIIRNGAWAITNLCRGLPVPDKKFLTQANSVLCKVIKSGAFSSGQHKQILSDVLWAISYMTQGTKSKIEKLSKAGILEQMFQFVNDPYKNVYIPALKIIGNFSNGNENHADELIKNGVLELSLKLLDHPKKQLRRQMCWILSNLSAGVAHQANLIMSRVDLLDKVGTLFHQDVMEVKRQICWIYANLGHSGDKKRLLEIILHYDVMRIFANMLNQTDPQTLENVLETVFKILMVGKKYPIDNKNIALAKFIEYGGANRLQDLQMHENKAVYTGTIKVLTKFFQLEDSANL